MDKILKEKLAISLCAADVSCSYIAVNPVLGNRDELIENQQVIYKTLLDNVESVLTPEFVSIEHKVLDQLWHSAIELTAADIVSKAISLDPILYDRTAKVNERIIFHFNRLKNYFPLDFQNSIQAPIVSVNNKKITSQCNNTFINNALNISSQPLQNRKNSHYKKHKRHKK